tara:strand:- start:1405 stop:1686 length:282 start_codon:yes stop_codon:yes gene_type:complete
MKLELTATSSRTLKHGAEQKVAPLLYPLHDSLYVNQHNSRTEVVWQSSSCVALCEHDLKDRLWPITAKPKKEAHDFELHPESWTPNPTFGVFL